MPRLDRPDRRERRGQSEARGFVADVIGDMCGDVVVGIIGRIVMLPVHVVGFLLSHH